MGFLRGWILDTIYKFKVNDGTERTVFDENGYLYQRNVKLTASGADMNATSAMVLNQGVKAVSSAAKACSVNGLNVVAGATGLADATLGAPTVGARCVIRIGSLSSGDVVVTCATGVTLNGTNKIATFNAAEEALVLVYKAANTWEIESNIGGVAISGT
jgi:hypothetical protein